MSDVDRNENAAAPKRFMVQLNKPPTTDGFDEVSPVVDMTNFELSPDGTFVFPRRGSAVYRRYALPQPGERMRLLVESQPPNLSDGSELAMIVSAENGIEAMHLFKTRTNLPGDTFQSKIFFDPASYTILGGGLATITVIRTGALDRRVSADWETQDGTAIAGTDYTAGSGTVTFASGETSQTIEVSATPVIQSEQKTFSVKLSNPTNGGTIENPRVAEVLIDAGAPAMFVSGYYSAAGGAGGDSEAYMDVLLLARAHGSYAGIAYLLHTSRGLQQTGSTSFFAMVETPTGVLFINNSPPIGGVQVDFWTWATIQATPFGPNPTLRISPDESASHTTSNTMYKVTRDGSCFATISADGTVYVPLVGATDTIELLRINGTTGAILGTVNCQGDGTHAHFDSLQIAHLDADGKFPVYFKYVTPAAAHKITRFDPTDGTGTGASVNGSHLTDTVQSLFTFDTKDRAVVDVVSVADNADPDTELVTNGTFEGSFTDGLADDWTDWTSTGTMEFYDSSYDKYSGSHAQGISQLEAGRGGIYQTITTIAGHTYSLSVALKKNTISTGAELKVGYDLSGGVSGAAIGVVYPIEVDTADNLDWVQATAEFTATGTSTTIFVQSYGVSVTQNTLVVLYDGNPHIYDMNDAVAWTLAVNSGTAEPTDLIRHEVILDAGRFAYVDTNTYPSATVDVRVNQDFSAVPGNYIKVFNYTKNIAISYEFDLFTSAKGTIAGLGKTVPGFTSAGWPTTEVYGYAEDQIVQLLTGLLDIHVKNMWAPINSALVRQRYVSGTVEV